MTEFKILYGGSSVVTARCRKCKQSLNYPTDRPYNYCPYCGEKAEEVDYGETGKTEENC